MNIEAHTCGANKDNAPNMGDTQLCRLSAEEIMSSPVQSAYEGWSIKMLMDFFLRHNISGAPVITNDGELVGVVTLSDIVRFENLPLLEKEKLASISCYAENLGFEYSKEDLAKMMKNVDINCTINQIMTPNIISTEAEASIVDVAKLLRSHKIHRVFVVRDKKVAGVVSTSNLLDAMIKSCTC